MSNWVQQTFDRGDARHVGPAMQVCAAAIALGRGLLPQRCTLCVASAGGALLCRACEESLPRLPQSCPVCALPSPAAAVCASCATRPPPYIATVAALVYAHPADHLLRQLKYRGRLALANWAAAALASAVRARLEARMPGEYPERVVALPLARARQRERGFNQAGEIAKRVARTLALPLAPVLERAVAGPPQAALPWRERRHNVCDAFAARGDVRGARLALVDDVMTTGATLAAAALALERAGAAQVECWVVARTLPPGAA